MYAGNIGERTGHAGGGAAGGGQHNDACLHGGLDGGQVARADVLGIVKNGAVQIQPDQTDILHRFYHSLIPLSVPQMRHNCKLPEGVVE